MITILTGNVLDTLPTLPSNSVQCCVTSPPYWGLRSYLPDGHADKGFELGSEATPQEYVANMVAVFREVKRVLRDDGTFWLNLGDSYVGSNALTTNVKALAGKQGTHRGTHGTIPPRDYGDTGLKPKDLCGIPWRVAFALQADGWWLRSEITWCKKAPMPESVTDRPTSATEKIFLLTKSARYFYDAEAVKEANADPERTNFAHGAKMDISRNDVDRMNFGGGDNAGRNQRNFWLLGPEPYAEAHFATFPTEIPRRAILAGTSAHGACPTCGAPWERVVERGERVPAHERARYDWHTNAPADGFIKDGEYQGKPGWKFENIDLGFAPTCTCGHEDTVPCVVLDPFTGSGTTGAVARTLGRSFIGCELNPEYVKLAEKRIGHAQPALFGI